MTREILLSFGQEGQRKLFWRSEMWAEISDKMWQERGPCKYSGLQLSTQREQLGQQLLPWCELDMCEKSKEAWSLMSKEVVGLKWDQRYSYTFYLTS